MKRTLFSSIVAAILVIAALVATERTSHAQTTPGQGFVVDRFEPSERGSDWFVTESLDFRGVARPAVGIVGDYVKNPLVTFRPNGDINQRIVESALALHGGAVVNFLDRFRLAIDVPLYASMNGQAQTVGTTDFPAPTGGGIGDLRFGTDLRVGGTYGDAFNLALGIRAWAPTGSENAYSGDGRWRVEQHALVAGEAGIWAYGVKLAYLYRGRRVGIDDVAIGAGELGFAASLGVRVAKRKLLIGPETFGSTQLDVTFARRTTPVEALMGVHFSPIPSVRIGGGVGRGFTKAFGSPDLRVIFGLEWFMDAPPADRDGDGVLDADDACPDEKGLKNDDPTKNGCPLTAAPDRDKDGIPDAEDACPDEPGDKNDDPKKNGCPTDRDGDGIYDKIDACPDIPGVKTEDPKTNGCPPDKDGDGILDKDDACPAEAGIKTDDPWTNGCPDVDGDGITSVHDACPDVAGPPDPDPKKNGCPKAYIKDNEIKITDQVKFKTNSAEILPGKDSEGILRAVYKILADHPEVKRVRVEGYTDSTGGAALNKKLSAARAASVAKWLVANGMSKDRLTSTGFGPEHPIGDNKTEEGRRQNRRVEFHIEDAATPAK